MTEHEESALRQSAADAVQGGLTEAEKRQNVIELAFGGSVERFNEFCRLSLFRVTGFFVPGISPRGIRICGWTTCSSRAR